MTTQPIEINNAQPLWNDSIPSDLLVAAAKLVGSGAALDLGAGKGRNSLHLATHGFTVTAVDSDTAALDVLRRKMGERGSTITVTESDIHNFIPTEQYDIIVCDMVLHFFSLEDVVSTIKKLQNWTKPGGYNLVTGYSDVNEPGKRPYLFKHNELPAYYSDWEIVSYDESPTQWFIKPGETEPRRNHAVYLLAKKI